MNFKLGRLVMTNEMHNCITKDTNFDSEVATAFKRYVKGDWGNISEEDKLINEEALNEGGTLMGAYDTSKGEIWIITEGNRSITTILFTDEPHEWARR